MFRAADLGRDYAARLQQYADSRGMVPQRGDRKRDWCGRLPAGVTWQEWVDAAAEAAWDCQRDIATAWREQRRAAQPRG